MRLGVVLVAGVLALSSIEADAARRLGGGGSMGRQSGQVTQRESAPPTAPSQGAAGQQAAAKPGAQPAATSPAAVQPAPRRPWGAMLGGLAAGLGLAWLASSLGLGAAFAEVLLLALLALVAMGVVGWVLRARRSRGSPRIGDLAYQSAAGAATQAQAPRDYSPDKVGNDASARPWERNSMAFDAAKYTGGGVQIGSGLAGPQGWGIPAGFDAAGFVSAAKRNFVTLQDAWDRSDIPTLRAMMTDEMLGEIKAQLAEREAHRGAVPNRTDVVMLDAQLLGIEDLGEAWLASVEFSGMIREEPSAGPSPFREVWNMTKPKSGGSGWLVAGVQALQ